MKTECVAFSEVSSTDHLLKEELATFWSYETLGIKDGELDMYDNYVKTIKQNESRYEVTLPLKQDHPIIPYNYTTAHHRLGFLIKRLRLSSPVLYEYDI
jgi:hypothetical protein